MVEKKASTKKSESDQISENINQENSSIVSAEQNMVCGIVMPISAIDGLSDSHWFDVKNIIESSIKFAGFSPNLVSNADEAGIIQQRIIQNLYTNPIVVCDVSCKNPNVMFELGMRLAFDKPTIIIKDDKTDYSFDTSIIEHLTYPRDLRFNEIEIFRVKLTEKIQATFEKSKEAGYSTFLKNFKILHVEKLDTKELPVQDFIIEKLVNIENRLSNLSKNYSEQIKSNKLSNSTENLTDIRYIFNIDLENIKSNFDSYINAFENEIIEMDFGKIKGVNGYHISSDTNFLKITINLSNYGWAKKTIEACQEMLDEIVLKLKHEGY